MKASPIYSFWLKVRAVWLTLKASLICLYYSSRWVNADRAKYDGHLKRWADSLAALFSLTVQIDNPHNIQFDKGNRYIIMCNHTSLFDIPLTYVGLTSASIRMLAKKELSRIPFFGKAMRVAQFPFIDRKNRHQAIKDLQYAKSLMEQGIALWVAPEGTRSKDGKLQKFKKGAFITAIESEALIIPLYIDGAYEIWPYGSNHANTHQNITLRLGEMIDAAEYGIDEKEALLDRAYSTMQALSLQNQ